MITKMKLNVKKEIQAMLLYVLLINVYIYRNRLYIAMSLECIHTRIALTIVYDRLTYLDLPIR